MKSIKVIMVSALSVMTLAATATPSAMAKISVASASGNGNDALILVESADCSADIETTTGKDIVKIMNDGSDYSINLYAVSQGTNLSAIGTDDLSNTAVTFASNKLETDYTMTFSNVIGTVKLYDAVEDQEITLANAGTYSFTAAANTVVADRFIINYVPAAPSICFNYNVLEINGHAGEALIVKKGADEIANVASLPAKYSLDLSAQSGRLVVTLNGQDYQIDANPAVTPAN